MSKAFGSGFEAGIARMLGKSGARFSSKPLLGGLQPDFVLTGPGDKQIVIEAKRWPTDAPHMRRAINQAQLYRRATNADEAFIVVEGLKKGKPAQGVLGVKDLRSLIARGWTQPKPERPSHKPSPGGKRGTRRRTASKSRKALVFAAMPFAAEFDDVYFFGMAHAAKQAGVTCTRVDREEFEGDIVGEIERRISVSKAVIADLSGAKPNVMYELGFAHGLPRPTVLICSTPLSDLPFDVRNLNVISYKHGQVHSLREALAKRLKLVLNTKAKAA